MVLIVGFDPRGYLLGGSNLFKLANEKLVGIFHLYGMDNLLLYGTYLYVASAAVLLHRDFVYFST